MSPTEYKGVENMARAIAATALSELADALDAASKDAPKGDVAVALKTAAWSCRLAGLKTLDGVK